MSERPLRRKFLIASAMAVLPYLVFNMWWIFSATDSIVHMSKAEWAIWTLVSTLGLWLVCAVVLAVATAVAKSAWLAALLSLIVFAGTGITIATNLWGVVTGTIIAPNFWESLLFDPFENGIGPSLVVTGLLSVVFVNVLARVRPAGRFS